MGFRNLDITTVLLSVIPALVCITFHEFAHGLTALKLGDNTAREMGRLSLNPIKHIDPFGLLMMILVGFGWAKPVPVNMRSFKNPKRGMAITAAAGPISNVLLALIMLLLFWLLYTPLGGGFYDEPQLTILRTIVRTAQLSCALAVFNLIPIPPLDGSKVLFSLVSDEAYYKLMRYERYGMILLIVVLWTGALDSTIGNASSFLFDKLSDLAQFARLS